MHYILYRIHPWTLNYLHCRLSFFLCVCHVLSINLTFCLLLWLQSGQGHKLLRGTHFAYSWLSINTNHCRLYEHASTIRPDLSLSSLFAFSGSLWTCQQGFSELDSLNYHLLVCSHANIALSLLVQHRRTIIFCSLISFKQFHSMYYTPQLWSDLCYQQPFSSKYCYQHGNTTQVLLSLLCTRTSRFSICICSCLGRFWKLYVLPEDVDHGHWTVFYICE